MKKYLKTLFYAAVAIAFSTAHAGAYQDFFRAVDVDDARTVNSLLERGFDPNAVSERGQVALFVALQSESERVVDALLARPDLRVDQANAKGETPLMMAALRGRADWTAQIIQRGGRINQEGWTPLHYAASGPEPKVVALLLERGALVDAPSPNRTTPLMMAAGYGSQDATQLLLAQGASARLRNDVGLSAGDFARRAGRDKLADRLDAAAR